MGSVRTWRSGRQFQERSQGPGFEPGLDRLFEQMYIARTYPTSQGTMSAYVKQPPTVTNSAEPCPQHWQRGCGVMFTASILYKFDINLTYILHKFDKIQNHFIQF